MKWVYAPAVLAVMTILSSCSREEPIEYLTFEYFVGPMSASTVSAMNSDLSDGTRTFNDPAISGMTTCRYEANFSPPVPPNLLAPGQAPEKPELDATVDTNATPNEYALDIDADQALTKDARCNNQIADTIQGLDLETGSDRADGVWRPGSEGTVVFRPQLPGDVANNGLGDRVDFNAGGARGLFVFQYRINGYNANDGYTTGEFQMLAVNHADATDDRLVIVRNGEFGLINRTP